MFQELVSYQAALHPERPAVILPGRVVSYRALHRDVERFALKLRDLVAPDGVALVGVGRFYKHLVLRTALYKLGVTMASSPPSTLHERAEQLRPDLVLCEPETAPLPANAVVVDGGWWRAPSPDAPVPPLRPSAPDDLTSIVVSSGTTGTPKKILFRREGGDERLLLLAMNLRLGPGARLLSMMGFDTAGGSAAAFVCWMWGGAPVADAKTLLDPAVPRRLKPTVLLASPAHLRGLLAQLPHDAEPMPWMSVWSGGSVLPQALADEVRRRLSPQLSVIYGSTEAGSTASGPAYRLQGLEGAAGYVNPGSQVQIVGDDGRPVPAGQLGEVRVRGPGMASGYMDDEAQSRDSFRDGWFHPGDIGRLDPDGLLTIAGRTSEMFNWGGVKMAFSSLEEVALACPGVRDAGACKIANAEGFEQGWIGVAVGEGFDRKELRRRLAARFSKLPLRLAVLPEIPRNPMGKIPREDLADAIARTVPDARAVAAPVPRVEA